MTLIIIFSIIISIAILFVIIGYASSNSSNNEMDIRIQKRVTELKNNHNSNNLNNKAKKKVVTKKQFSKSIEDDIQLLDQKIAEQEKISREFQIAFNDVTLKMKTAKSLEKSNIYTAISLYEECLYATVGNFCPEERLVILYSKTLQTREEIKMCKILIRKQPQQYVKWKSRLDKLTTK